MVTTPKLKLDQSARLHEVLVETFEQDSDTLELFAAILEARYRPDNQKVQARALLLCLAEVMAHPLMPSDLYNAMADAVCDIQSENNADDILRSDALVPALIAIAAREGPREPIGSTVKPKPVRRALIEGQVIVAPAGNVTADNQAIKTLETAIAKAVKATGLDVSPRIMFRYLEV